MFVRMLTVYCTANRYCDPGKVIDVPDAEAKELIAGKYAELPKENPPPKVKKGKVTETDSSEPRGKELDKITEDEKG